MISKQVFHKDRRNLSADPSFTGKPRRQRGFTLLEVMVALVIVGTALPALLFQVMTTTDQVAYLRDKALAQWVAQNKMTELRLLRQLKGEILNGSDAGEMEMAQTQWGWKAKAEKTPLAENFKRIVVTVTRGKEKEPLVTLEGIMSDPNK